MTTTTVKWQLREITGKKKKRVMRLRIQSWRKEWVFDIYLTSHLIKFDTRSFYSESAMHRSRFMSSSHKNLWACYHFPFLGSFRCQVMNQVMNQAGVARRENKALSMITPTQHKHQVDPEKPRIGTKRRVSA